jgi:recombination protein RecR
LDLGKGIFFSGKYHVLGGLVSAFHGHRPDGLNIDSLQRRLDGSIKEVIIALDGTMEGQTTLNYLTQKLKTWHVSAHISTLARGLPVGGALGYADQGTLTSAFSGRQTLPALGMGTEIWKNDASIPIDANSESDLFFGEKI